MSKTDLQLLQTIKSDDSERAANPFASENLSLSQSFTDPVRIILEATLDDERGPYPPLGDGWHLVRSRGGGTLWRKIAL
jgi:hypothetical protein